MGKTLEKEPPFPVMNQKMLRAEKEIAENYLRGLDPLDRNHSGSLKRKAKMGNPRERIVGP